MQLQTYFVIFSLTHEQYYQLGRSVLQANLALTSISGYIPGEL